MLCKNNVSWEGFDSDYKHRLAGAVWSIYFEGNPFDYFGHKTMFNLALKEKVLDFAGEDVCLHPKMFDADSVLDMEIIAKGHPFDAAFAKIIDKPMSVGNCFVNAWEFAHMHKLQLCLGFYMDKSGLWRKHAWCIDHNMRIIEPTKLGVAYWGIVVESRHEDNYVKSYI